jgi:CubicO group peptidase (beta-lactamase class C family)
VILAAAIEVASGMPYEDYMLEGVVDRRNGGNALLE